MCYTDQGNKADWEHRTLGSGNIGCFHYGSYCINVRNIEPWEHRDDPRRSNVLATTITKLATLMPCGIRHNGRKIFKKHME